MVESSAATKAIVRWKSILGLPLTTALLSKFRQLRVVRRVYTWLYDLHPDASDQGIYDREYRSTEKWRMALPESRIQFCCGKIADAENITRFAWNLKLILEEIVEDEVELEEALLTEDGTAILANYAERILVK